MPPQKSPPGPPGHPLVGSLFPLVRDPLAFLSHCAHTYGDIARYRVGNVTAFLLNHPDSIKSVLMDQNRSFVKGRMLRANRLLLGNGLATSEGGEWLRQRRLAQPAFHRERVVEYGNVMVEYAQRLALTWREGECRDIHRDMNRLAQAIAAKTLFDADIADSSEDVSRALDQALVAFRARTRTAFLIPTFLPTPNNVRLRRAVRELDEIIFRIIESRRGETKPRDDLLARLMQARDENGQPLRAQELRDQVMTIFLAGHEPVGVALAWTIYLLAKHPRVEEKLFLELSEVLDARAPCPADLSQLPYLESVVKESLRLYPPIWGIVRMAIEDCEIGGYRVRAGNSIAMSQWVMHRDARYFENPEEFLPERWATATHSHASSESSVERDRVLDKMTRLPRFAYFPFGGGPRVCIGDSFALMECCLVIATLAAQFRFRNVDEQQIELLPSITLHPKNGIKVIVEKRNGVK